MTSAAPERLRKTYHEFLATADFTIGFVMKTLAILCLVSTILAVGALGDEPAMPTRATVGPAAMPREIAAVDPPFAMPQPERPRFADRTVNIADRGASAGGSELVTPIIQQTIDETSAAGGGTVIIPAGTWHSGRIVLKSGVNLHVAERCELRFSGQIDDYMPVVPTWYEGVEVMTVGGLIYAHQQTNIAVTGGGTLFGPEAGPLREARPGLVENLVSPTTPVEERIFDAREGRHYFRPNFISLVDCEHVFVEGITLRHGPMWHVSLIECDGAVVRGVTIESRGVVNGDGVDVVASRNVLVEYCHTNTGDDCYVLKAGRSAELTRPGKSTENVVMRYNLATGGTGGVTCGSETAGGIRNVHIHDCVFENVRHCVYMKTRRPRSGGGGHWLVERIAFSAGNTAIAFDMLGAPIYVGELAERLPPRPRTPQTPYYRDITFRRLVGQCNGDVLKIKGIPESPATAIVLEDCDIRGPGLIHLADVADMQISNSRFESVQPDIRLLDASNILFDGIRFASTGRDLTIDVRGPNSHRIHFRGCEPAIVESRITTGKSVSAEVVTVTP
jgi:hypothetical protein